MDTDDFERQPGRDIAESYRIIGDDLGAYFVDTIGDNELVFAKLLLRFVVLRGAIVPMTPTGSLLLLRD